jgi:hypothetical protein
MSITDYASVKEESHPDNEKLPRSNNGPRGEQHHLLQKLLGGTNDSANMILLSCGTLSKILILLEFVFNNFLTNLHHLK